MKNFSIRQPEPKATTLNRPLLIVAGAIVVLIILWAFITALEPTEQVKDKTLSMSNQNTQVAPSPLLNNLPKNYQDVNAIRKYLSNEDALSPEVSAELNKLRAEEAKLQAELSAMQNHPDNPTDPGREAAIKSDLFFAAAKPTQADLNNKNAQNPYPNSMINTPYTQQNMQTQKSNFLQSTQTQGDVYNQYNMITPKSPYEVQAGTIIAANLLTAINTSLPGDIVSQVRQDVYDSVSGKYLLIPKGSKLLGKYDSSVAYGQERILIGFDRIVRPDGSSIQLSNFTGSDAAGSSGLMAGVDNHWSKILGAATISTMLSFGAGVAADRNAGPNYYYPGAQQSGIAGAASGISQTGQSITNRAIDIQPTLTVPAGFNFTVIVNKDMVLKPYVQKTL